MTTEHAQLSTMAASTLPTNVGRAPTTNAVAGAAGGMVSVLLGKYPIGLEDQPSKLGKCRSAFWLDMTIRKTQMRAVADKCVRPIQI